MLLPYFAASLCYLNTVEHYRFAKAKICVWSIVDFTLISQEKSDTDETIQYLEWYLEAYYDYKDVIKKY